MSDNVGRRPDGPGWYWYEGPGQWRAWIDEPVWVSPPYVECRTRHRDEIVSDMPGSFTPLHPPVAAPEPDWSQAPGWAMWWAVDANGAALWWETEPYAVGGMWERGQEGLYQEDVTQRPGWQDTLRKRPEVKR